MYMKTKFQNINSKLVILETAIIIIGLIIAIYSFTTIDVIKENFNLLNDVNTLKINITKQDQEISNLLENDQFNISFYKNEKIKSISAFSNIQSNDSVIIERLCNNLYVKENTYLVDKFTGIRENLKKYDSQFHILIINLKDRGYRDYGKMGEVSLALNQIIESVGILNDFILNESLDELTKKVENFGQSFEKSIGEEIIAYVDKFVSQIYLMSENYPGLDLNEITNQFNGLKENVLVVLQTNESIGLSERTGVLSKIRILSSDITEDLLTVSEVVDIEIPLRNEKASQRILIIFIIISIALALYVAYIIKSFIYPISALKKYIKKIEQGVHPEPLEFKQQDEVSEVSHSMAKVVNGLKEKTEFAMELGKGNLNASYLSISEDDTLGNALLTLQKSLQKAAEEDKKHKEENERRRWANEGLATFSEILRMNNDNTEMLCDSVIKNLVKYLDASLGGIYLYKEENKENIHLYLSSAFAYDRKKFIKQQISLGEGLIGACAVEKKTIYMTDIPKDYVVITSGLGKENPNVLLIVPLNLENEVLGVLEIASFNKFEKHVLDFVEKLADSIASTLASAKINERTQKLLEQSQKQAVEMAEQEEEMRQNMEELQTTQEESSRRESEMYGILHAINATSFYFETDIQGSVTDINERLLFILEMQKENVIGMHHSELTSMNKNSPEYIAIWSELKGGNSVTKIQKYESISGNEIWLKQSYTPIFNKDGEAIKVVCISTDITETVELEKDIQKIERELFAQNNELDYINATLNMAFLKCVISNEGFILEANSRIEKLTGYAIKELYKKQFKELLEAEQRKSFERIWDNIVNGHPFTNVIKFKTVANDNRLVKSNFKPIMNDKDELIKVIFIGEYLGSESDMDSEQI